MKTMKKAGWIVAIFVLLANFLVEAEYSLYLKGEDSSLRNSSTHFELVSGEEFSLEVGEERIIYANISCLVRQRDEAGYVTFHQKPERRIKVSLRRIEAVKPKVLFGAAILVRKRNEFWQELERRFGQAETDVISRWGTSYFNGLKGWQFSEEEVMEANKNGELLTMDVDFPGNRCRLNCTYCFAKAGEKTGTYYRPGAGKRPLTISEIKSFLLDAKKLGLKSSKVIGFREPFDNPGFYDFIDFATANSLQTVIFTAGYTLGEKEFGGNLQKAMDFLAERPVSLMVKLHTLDIEKEDTIVRRKGFSKARDRILRAFLDDGRFTNCNPSRLGIENVISSQDIEELLAIYEYFKIRRNVFVDLDPPIPIGRTGTLAEAEKAGLLPQDRLKDLCLRTYQVNQRYGIPIKGISPYFGGDPCTQLSNGLYLTLSGKVMTCCGSDEEIGDVRSQSVEEIFENNPHRKKNCLFHNCPYREKRGIMTQDFIEKVKYKLS